MESLYSVGSRVVTRNGKRGTVKANLGNGKILVAFSPTHDGFEMRETAVISESAYDTMGKGYSKQQYQ